MMQSHRALPCLRVVTVIDRAKAASPSACRLLKGSLEEAEKIEVPNEEIEDGGVGTIFSFQLVQSQFLSQDTARNLADQPTKDS